MGNKKLGVIFDKWVGLTDFNMEISKKKNSVSTGAMREGKEVRRDQGQRERHLRLHCDTQPLPLLYRCLLLLVTLGTQTSLYSYLVS